MDRSRVRRSCRNRARRSVVLLKFAFGSLCGKLRRVKFLARLDPRHGAAILAVLLLAASFPKPGLAGLAWIAPGLMLFVAVGQRGKERFRIGYLAGLVHYLVSLYWLLFIPFPAGAVVGWLALSAYLALYPATWVWLCWRLISTKKCGGGPSWWAAGGGIFPTKRGEGAWGGVLRPPRLGGLGKVGSPILSGFPWYFF